MLYQIHTCQKLPTTLETAWNFLSAPENLETITPKMGFKILSGAGTAMFQGQIIQYTIAPFPGIRTRWVTEITHLSDKNYFVDEQRFGPYAFWHHKHFITEVEGGVLMEDIVDYKLPLGILGRLMHTLVVKRKLKAIFEYRAMQLITLFGKTDDEQTSITIKKIC
ncbi:MAG: SRPBCC family protein [Bacteroidota bacterium]